MDLNLQKRRNSGVCPALRNPLFKVIPAQRIVFTPVPPERQSCLNCDAEMTLDHQCGVLVKEREVHEDADVVEEQLPPLPLCHFCCHRGRGEDPLHSFLQCICDDWPCTCWCFCTEAQLQHKELVFPAGFSRPGYKVKTVNAVDRPKALESLGRVKDWHEKALQLSLLYDRF